MNEQSIGNTSFKQFRTWSLIAGIGLIVLGLVTLLLASVTTLVTVLVLGIVLAVRGAVVLFHALQSRGQPNFGLRLFHGILSLGLGVLFIAMPGISAAALTLFLGGFFAVVGLYEIVDGMRSTPRAGWEIASGVLALILGGVVLLNWPGSALWLLGVLVGAEILSYGLMLTMMPVAARKTWAQERQAAEDWQKRKAA